MNTTFGKMRLFAVGLIAVQFLFPGTGRTFPLYTMGFQGVAGSTPSVVSVNPAGGLASGGLSVTITGKNFVNGITAKINGVACGISNYISPTQMTCTVPASGAGNIAQVDVQVTLPDLRSATLTGGFFYLGAPGLWLRADAGVTQTSNIVSDWADQSATANHMTQATAGRRPTYVPSSAAFNNRPTVQFTGSSSQTLNPTVLSTFANVGAASFALAASTTNRTVLQTLFHFSINTNGNASRFGTVIANNYGTDVGSSTGDMCIGARRLDTDTHQRVCGGTMTNNVAFGSTGVINYATQAVTVALNKTVVSTSSTLQTAGNTSNTNSANTGGAIGSANGTDYFTGQIAEILLYASALSTPQRQVLENYLSVRYNLP